MPGHDHRFLVLRRVVSVTLVGAIGLWSFLFGMTLVCGGSMEPTLYPGDLVVYRRGGAGALVGDVVLFKHHSGRGSVLHRLTSYDEDGTWRTKGDANDATDTEPLCADKIRGVVVAVVPAGRVWGRLRWALADVLHSSTNRSIRSNDGEALGTTVPTGMGPHGLRGLQERAKRFTPTAAT